MSKPKLSTIQMQALRWAANAPGGCPPKHLRTWQSLQARGLVAHAFHGFHATDAGREVLAADVADAVLAGPLAGLAAMRAGAAQAGVVISGE